jgi:hypothetical protein
LEVSHATWFIVGSYIKGIYGTHTKKKTLFDGTKEHRMAHNELFRDQLLQQLRMYQICRLKKTRKKRERKGAKRVRLRHNLDIMYIEKNICDSLLGKLLNIDGKSKDSLKAQHDLFVMGIHKDLHLQQSGTFISMPHANYIL